MKVAVLEVRYAGGLDLTDHVVVQKSSRLTLSPRLSALLGILEKSERQISMSVKVDGVSYRVERKQDGEYVVGARLSLTASAGCPDCDSLKRRLSLSGGLMDNSPIC